jgi:hypothetical protein
MIVKYNRALISKIQTVKEVLKRKAVSFKTIDIDQYYQKDKFQVLEDKVSKKRYEEEEDTQKEN